MKQKFKLGDIVEVLSFEHDSYYNKKHRWLKEDMDCFLNKKCVIIDVDVNDNYYVVKILNERFYNPNFFVFPETYMKLVSKLDIFKKNLQKLKNGNFK